jgi:hypothetical protein
MNLIWNKTVLSVGLGLVVFFCLYMAAVGPVFALASGVGTDLLIEKYFLPHSWILYNTRLLSEILWDYISWWIE